jgi:hypothetical protein
VGQCRLEVRKLSVRGFVEITNHIADTGAEAEQQEDHLVAGVLRMRLAVRADVRGHSLGVLERTASLNTALADTAFSAQPTSSRPASSHLGKRGDGAVQSLVK